jgi:hypothetical protein
VAIGLREAEVGCRGIGAGLPAARQRACDQTAQKDAARRPHGWVRAIIAERYGRKL